MSWISEVAKATGKTEQTVRLAIQQGWEIGIAVKVPGSRTYNYMPNPQKIRELIGNIGGIDGTRDNCDCAGCSHNCKSSTEEREKTR